MPVALRPLPSRAAGAGARPARARAARSIVTMAGARPPAESGDMSLERYPWIEPGYKGAWVSSQDESTQKLAVGAVWAGLGVGTVATCTSLAPFIANNLPFLYWPATFPLIGLTYLAAGVAHFTAHESFKDLMPHEGAWGGLWTLPGSKSFHVNWTGVAEVLGGAGLLLGALPIDAVPDWLEPASAWGLLLLTIVVTPANTYMWRHNARGPGPELTEEEEAEEGAGVVPWTGHLTRALLQVMLFSMLWGMATGSA